MQGKQKCRILKEIRRKIADENDIPFVTQECRHQGDCLGTCPRCESELRYLERELSLRASLGKRITVAALCAGMAFAGAACGAQTAPAASPDPGEQLSGEVAPIETVCPTENPEEFIEMGEVAMPFEEEPDPETTLPPESEPVYIQDDLTGLVPYDD